VRDFHLPGRSPVHGLEAMVAAPNPLATHAGIEMLARGGNAVDAAVAAMAVLAVVEPNQTGIGGDCFALMAPKGATPLVAYNGSGRAPAAADAEALRARGLARIGETSAHAVTVPGAVEAWCRLVAEHGRTEMGAVLERAIGYAEGGFPVHARVARDWAIGADRLTRDPGAAAVFLPGGRAPRAGEIHRQTQLARTLRRIADGGAAAFYTGPVAEDIVAHLRAHGGVHDLDDFEHAAGAYVTPVATGYRGFRVCQMPPNNQGLTALMMLDVLARLGAGAADPLDAARLHLEIEAARLAYAERDRWIGDAGGDGAIAERLLAPATAERLCAAIDPDRAAALGPERARVKTDTVYVCVVDRDRTCVSLINSLFHDFGTGLMAPESGVLLQSRGVGFRLEPGHPNTLEPGKRPLHTIMPGMLVEGERAVMPFGVMGGEYQPLGHVHFLTNLLDFGLDIQESLDLPRVFHDGTAVRVERGVPEAARSGLARRAHRVETADEPHGGGQAIRIDWRDGVLTGGSDPRMDGCALGF